MSSYHRRGLGFENLWNFWGLNNNLIADIFDLIAPLNSHLSCYLSSKIFTILICLEVRLKAFDLLDIRMCIKSTERGWNCLNLWNLLDYLLQLHVDLLSWSCSHTKLWDKAFFHRFVVFCMIRFWFLQRKNVISVNFSLILIIQYTFRSLNAVEKVRELSWNTTLLSIKLRASFNIIW